MKIEIRSEILVQVGDLENGSTFQYDGDYYIKTSNYKESPVPSVLCVSLLDGETLTFGAYDEVVPVNMKAVVY